MTRNAFLNESEGGVYHVTLKENDVVSLVITLADKNEAEDLIRRWEDGTYQFLQEGA